MRAIAGGAPAGTTRVARPLERVPLPRLRGGCRMATVITAVDPQLATVSAPASPAATAFDPAATAVEELDRQVRAYLESGVASMLRLDESGFSALVAP